MAFSKPPHTVDDGLDDFVLLVEVSDESDNDAELLSEVAHLEKDRALIHKDENLLLIHQSKLQFHVESDVEYALALNRAVDEHLKLLEERLLEKFKVCKKKLALLDEMIKPVRERDINTQLSYFRCGIPYFKDLRLFSHPPNVDTLKMNEADMLSYNSCVSRKWNVEDKNKLENEMLKISRRLRAESLTSQIVDIKRLLEPSDTSKINVVNLEKQLSRVDDLPLKDVALPIDQEYDWDLIADCLYRRHSAFEIRSLWKTYLHPSINKCRWSKRDHVRLERLAIAYNGQDWDAVARDLNTNRTAFQCFIYYKLKIDRAAKGIKWAKEEVEHLKYVVDTCKIGNCIPWGKVLYFIGDKSRIQIYNRYQRCLGEERGFFSPEEDKVLLACLDRFGGNFKKISEYLPKRTLNQVRRRCVTLMSPCTGWTVEEDYKLLHLISLQKNLQGRLYAKITKSFPGKNRAQVRQRFCILRKWLMLNPRRRLESAPRKAKILQVTKFADDLDEALKELNEKKRKEIKEVLCIEQGSASEKSAIEKKREQEDIDNKLINHFIFERFDRNDETSDNECLKAASLDMWSVATMLQVDLQKPPTKLNLEEFSNVKLMSYFCSNSFSPPNTINEVAKVKTYARKRAKLTADSGSDAKMSTRFDIPTSSSKIILPSSEEATSSQCSSLNQMSLLPPNLDTITAFKTVLSYSHFSAPIYERRNNSDRKFRMISPDSPNEVFKVWKERLQSLFFWPALLSQTMPNVLHPIVEEDIVPSSSEIEL